MRNYLDNIFQGAQIKDVLSFNYLHLVRIF